MSDWAALHVPGGPGSDRVDAADYWLAGCCERPVPNRSDCRREHLMHPGGVHRRRASLPFQSARAHRLYS